MDYVVDEIKLEAFGGKALVVGLDERDFIQEPIGSGYIGDVLSRRL